MPLLNACVHHLRARAKFVTLIVLILSVNTQPLPAKFAQSQDAAPKNAPAQRSPGSAVPTLPSQTPPLPEQNPTPSAGPIDFESHGMHYEALTRSGITVMFAPLPPHVKDYNIIQVTVTNGSPVSWTVKPGDFSFIRQDGTALQAISADEVVSSLLEKAGRNDVIKLQLLYESSIYALSNFRATNGYEQRREAAMAQFVNARFKAAAAASAITLVPAKLKPGESTDGAVFFENRTKDKSLGQGRFIAHTCGEVFTFETYPELKNR